MYADRKLSHIINCFTVLKEKKFPVVLAKEIVEVSQAL